MKQILPALVSATTAVAQHQPAGQADHMEHRFDNPEQLARRFDDPRRDEMANAGPRDCGGRTVVTQSMCLSPDPIP